MGCYPTTRNSMKYLVQAVYFLISDNSSINNLNWVAMANVIYSFNKKFDIRYLIITPLINHYQIHFISGLQKNNNLVDCRLCVAVTLHILKVIDVACP